MKPRLIAFYLPQYHPIPENDEWWGKGFTEWTNVTKAKPLFRGHYQPHQPADLGFYDLRVPEVREQQAELAREAGIEGFCYWHYWFAGKRLLERPFNEVLASGKPDFPFCLAWANESWKGIWHGADGRTLIDQTYPGEEDYINHFYDVLPAFRDSRYITIDGKPVFVIYKHHLVPNLNFYISLWRDLAAANGLAGIYFMGIRDAIDANLPSCLDGWITDNPNYLMKKLKSEHRSIVERAFRRLLRGKIQLDRLLSKPPILPYKVVVDEPLIPLVSNRDEFPSIFPGWDNTPRSGLKGTVLTGSEPSLFGFQLRKAMGQIEDRPKEKQIIFIKSWNEWAEGNYLEPDRKHGMGYLNEIREILNG